MAPDRGRAADADVDAAASRDSTDLQPRSSREARRDEAQRQLAERAADPTNFTIRGVLVGLIIGVVICFSNIYFGLQTGWISGMSMPSALIGFAFFRTISRYLKLPFTPIENVLIQSVAGSVGTMPLGCGFVGVIPALNYLLESEEGGPLRIGLWKLIVWAVGVCFFGVVFAVPLRREVIIREKLKFPSGTATALMISVLHGNKEKSDLVPTATASQEAAASDDERRGLISNSPLQDEGDSDETTVEAREGLDAEDKSNWRKQIKLLTWAFVISAGYTLISFFVPQIRNVPILGLTLANDWLWTLNPSPAYVGQGIIMGPATTLHMFIGAIVGWGILSPLAKSRGWAPGPVRDWTTGSKGWIVWVSLAIMLADSLVSLGWLVLRPLSIYVANHAPTWREQLRDHTWREIFTFDFYSSRGGSYSALAGTPSLGDSSTDLDIMKRRTNEDDADAPPSHLISNRVTLIGLVVSLALCIGAVHYSFAGFIPIYLTLYALLLAFLLSIMGVRALGETDLNPVSGISKLTQLLFAFAVPAGHAKHAVIINLIAGAISESGALQAGDLLQDLKAGHLLGASPAAQFWGQIIGSTVGAVVSACVYKLYTHVYEVPGGQFQVPTAYVWVFTARLVTGSGLPAEVPEWAAGAAVVFAATTMLRIFGNSRQAKWVSFVPGGIAVAVGMYNTPSFTLARTAGGLISWYWTGWRKRSETTVVVLASGLILGEGLFSIVNLLLESLRVPHF